MTKNYRVILTLKAPFCEPVEMPYGPAQPSKFQALSQLTNAMATHLDNDRWTSVQSIRIDVTEVPATDCDFPQDVDAAGNLTHAECACPTEVQA
jgi:hypothetical protein